jgi:hypothetical protein
MRSRIRMSKESRRLDVKWLPPPDCPSASHPRASFARLDPTLRGGGRRKGETRCLLSPLACLLLSLPPLARFPSPLLAFFPSPAKRGEGRPQRSGGRGGGASLQFVFATRGGGASLQFVFATRGGEATVMNWVASSIARPIGVGIFIQNGTRMRVPAIGANAISMLRWAVRYLITGRSGM